MHSGRPQCPIFDLHRGSRIAADTPVLGNQRFAKQGQTKLFVVVVAAFVHADFKVRSCIIHKKKIVAKRM
jgi:hypothetical protein